MRRKIAHGFNGLNDTGARKAVVRQDSKWCLRLWTIKYTFNSKLTPLHSHPKKSQRRVSKLISWLSIANSRVFLRYAAKIFEVVRANFRFLGQPKGDRIFWFKIDW
jgi:hypothetical protein